MKMTVNLHTHTARCNHASGTERDYIENAVTGGLAVLGFADHSPYVFRNGYYSDYRMTPEEQEDYVKTLTSLREEYKDKIDIKIGYEAEYYPALFDDFLKLITRFPLDYLILGQHLIGNEDKHVYGGRSTDDDFNAYIKQTCEGMRTGVFTYLAHPDLMNYTGDEKLYEKNYSALIECAMEMKMPLEINLLGIRDHRTYPTEKFFKLCGKYGAEVCVGCDAHDPKSVADHESFAVASEWIDRYGLKFAEYPRLVPVERV